MTIPRTSVDYPKININARHVNAEIFSTNGKIPGAKNSMIAMEDLKLVSQTTKIFDEFPRGKNLRFQRWNGYLQYE